MLATVGRLALLDFLRSVTGRLDDLRGAVFNIGGLIDCFRGKPREFLGILVIAVLARCQRYGQQPRGAVAQESGMVIPVGHPLTMIDLRDLLRDGRHRSAAMRSSLVSFLTATLARESNHKRPAELPRASRHQHEQVPLQA